MTEISNNPRYKTLKENFLKHTQTLNDPSALSLFESFFDGQRTQKDYKFLQQLRFDVIVDSAKRNNCERMKSFLDIESSIVTTYESTFSVLETLIAEQPEDKLRSIAWLCTKLLQKNIYACDPSPHVSALVTHGKNILDKMNNSFSSDSMGPIDKETKRNAKSLDVSQALHLYEELFRSQDIKQDKTIETLQPVADRFVPLLHGALQCQHDPRTIADAMNVFTNGLRRTKEPVVLENKTEIALAAMAIYHVYLDNEYHSANGSYMQTPHDMFLCLDQKFNDCFTTEELTIAGSKLLDGYERFIELNRSHLKWHENTQLHYPRNVLSSHESRNVSETLKTLPGAKERIDNIVNAVSLQRSDVVFEDFFKSKQALARNVKKEKISANSLQMQ